MSSNEANYVAGTRSGKGYSKGSRTTDWSGPGDVLVVNSRAVYQPIKPRGHLAELQAPRFEVPYWFPAVRTLA